MVTIFGRKLWHPDKLLNKSVNVKNETTPSMSVFTYFMCQTNTYEGFALKSQEESQRLDHDCSLRDFFTHLKSKIKLKLGAWKRRVLSLEFP